MPFKDQLPNDEQRRRLCELIAAAFVELRYLTGEQARDLAYAFHNMPLEIYGWGSWSVVGTRCRLSHYQRKHNQNSGFNYVEQFDNIFPLSP